MCNINDVLYDCIEYIDILRSGEFGCFLIRGVHDRDIDIAYKILSIDKRVPKNMPFEYHDALNKHFDSTFNWPVRNGLFSYGIKSNYKDLNDLGYGKPYFLFPCGSFQYVYDPMIFDLYEHLRENNFINDKEPHLISFLNSVNYKSHDINKAMSNIIYNDRSVEIIIKCDSYYLINMKYVDELIKLIWK